MLLYYLFWMLMGFILHFYIIFGTNLLTRGPAQIAVFLPISMFRRKGISNRVQTEWNLRERDFPTNMIQETWSGRQETIEEATRQGARLPPGRTLHPRGPRVAPPTYFFLLYMSTYTPKTFRSTTKPYFHCRNLLYPRDPILGPFPELHRRGHWSWRASTSTPWPLQWFVSSLL